MTLPPDQARVLRWIEEEQARGGYHNVPLAGLKLDKFRNTRAALARKGLIRLSPTGRWIPGGTDDPRD